MPETTMRVKLLAHTQLSQDFFNTLTNDYFLESTDGQSVALTAIRTCYSANKPSEILNVEGEKYFGSKPKDGGKGSDANRLIRHIVNSKHLSTLEHITFTFAVEGVSRSLLAQLTRHRVGFSYSVQSQRYVKFGSGDKSGGFDYVVPDTVYERGAGAQSAFKASMRALQTDYDVLRDLGVPAEDARSVLPNASACNLVMTVNLRALLDFYGKRQSGRGAQSEITKLAEELKNEVVVAEGWTEELFDKA